MILGWRDTRIRKKSSSVVIVPGFSYVPPWALSPFSLSPSNSIKGSNRAAIGISGRYSNKSAKFLKTNSSVTLSFLFGPCIWVTKPVMIVFSSTGASYDLSSIRWVSTVNAHPYKVSRYTLSWWRSPDKMTSFKVSLTAMPSRGLHTMMGSMCQRSKRKVVEISLIAGSRVLSLAWARSLSIRLDSTSIFWRLPLSNSRIIGRRIDSAW